MFKKKQLTVLYDGSCGFCLAMVRHFSKRDSTADVKWKGVFPSTHQERRDLKFRIIDNDGKEYFDTDARLLLLKTYPRYRFLAAALSFRICRFIIDPIFAFIASHRYSIAGAFGCSSNTQCEIKPEDQR